MPDDAMIVRSTIDLAHNLGIRWWPRASRTPRSGMAAHWLRRGAGLPHGPADAGHRVRQLVDRWYASRRRRAARSRCSCTDAPTGRALMPRACPGQHQSGRSAICAGRAASAAMFEQPVQCRRVRSSAPSRPNSLRPRRRDMAQASGGRGGCQSWRAGVELDTDAERVQVMEAEDAAWSPRWRVWRTREHSVRPLPAAVRPVGARW